MMYRGHTMTHAAHTKTSAGGAIDVTSYPDISELFLAADVLITDYSSVMFDFANTKKPIIFLTPDIEKYESQRGFYFDLRNDAPGPICSNTAEVIEALEDLDGLQQIYQSNYKAWQEKFVGLDDGGAAIRVVAKVFAAGRA
jgi:CDP-glycerol glycerophosphotransferase